VLGTPSTETPPDDSGLTRAGCWCLRLPWNTEAVPKALGLQAVHEACQRVYPSTGTCMNTQLHLLVPVQ
ncbi:Dihydrolipoamide acyltransferase, partial [Giardia duodenalis]